MKHLLAGLLALACLAFGSAASAACSGFTANTFGTTANGQLEALTEICEAVTPIVTTTTATIANGASLSGAVDLADSRLVALVIPSGWTTANITFQASADGSTYVDVYDEFGNEKLITVGGVSRFIPITPADFLGVRYLKVRSGTTGSAVNQAAERVITLVKTP